MKAMKDKIFYLSLIVVLISFLIGCNKETETSVSVSYAENKSYTTTCAEEDNVNFTLWNKDVKKFTITATHPQYQIDIDNCKEDFTNCSWAKAKPKSQQTQNETVNKLYDDGTTVVETVRLSNWWRPNSMDVSIKNGNKDTNVHYVRIYQKISDANEWPQFFVIYQDGNLRLIPHPPLGITSVCFGSSIIVGPVAVPDKTDKDNRPYVDIQSIIIDPKILLVTIGYKDGGTAQLTLSVNRTKAKIEVVSSYDAQSKPFATFRSMYITDGNADVDYVQNASSDLSIMTQETFQKLEGPWWYFYRKILSKHNTSAPDIKVEVME